MDYAEYLRRLPKVELHGHVEGTLRPAEFPREIDLLDAAPDEST